ncbi:CLUMA_CG008307, isoform A [Clunio marinus]|uniref:CLUMA_CG008307, isoform A n=1 Tax=Clunio marinus TaxID=568069 RepID=A0A1J1I3E3_9DIPT|nr:CLUMA_CG008307, isoform A [Clunio marinus]
MSQHLLTKQPQNFNNENNRRTCNHKKYTTEQGKLKKIFLVESKKTEKRKRFEVGNKGLICGQELNEITVAFVLHTGAELLVVPFFMGHPSNGFHFVSKLFVLMLLPSTLLQSVK